jgi:ribose transport system substrate-binding protein
MTTDFWAKELSSRREFAKKAGKTAAAAVFGLYATDLLAACGTPQTNASGQSNRPFPLPTISNYPGRPVIHNNYPDRPTEGPLLPDSITAKRPYVLGYSYPVFNNGFFVAVQYGLETEVKRLNINLISTFGTGYNHPEKQISDMEDLVAQKPDGIVCNQSDENAMRPIIDKAEDMGIVVTTHVIEPASAKYHGWAGVSHYDGGVVTTRLLIEAMRGVGKIIALDGPKGQPFSDEPQSARTDITPHESYIDIVAQQYTDTTRTQTTQIFENLFRAHPDIQGVWETFADPAVAVCLALKNMGKKPGEIKVVSKGWVADAKTWIENGYLYGTSLQKDVLTGQQAARLQVALLNGDKPPFHVLVPFEPVTKQNIDAVDLSTAQAPAGFTSTGIIRAH